MAELCKLPSEMALQILSRLPPKSLMRFKCVNKSWCTLIKDPKFVNKHLSNALHNNLHTTCLLYKRCIKRHPDADHKETDYKFSLLNFCNENDGGGEYDDIHYVVEEEIRKDGLEILDSGWIMGHCDGVLCLKNLTELMLWNPAIMELKINLPEGYVRNERLNVLGIGYDPKSKNHKVLNIYNGSYERYGDDNDHLLFDAPRIDVYTLGTDSWREITIRTLETETTNFWPDYFQMCFKGMCYWFGHEQLKEFHNVYDHMEEEYIRQMIISFDMVDEVFHPILFPDSLYDSFTCWYDMHLIVWNEFLALFGEDHGIFCEGSWDLWGLWVKDELDDCSGVKGSWIKQFTFPKAVGVEKPLYFWKRDEILMLSEDGHLVSYNLDTEKHKHLPRHSMNYDYFEVVVFVNSIVPL